MIAYFVFYLTLCWFVAFSGRNSALGFGGFFVLSIFITPFGGTLVLIIMSFLSRKATRKKQAKEQA